MLCTVCLGRHQHDIVSCNRVMLWDNVTRARCKRNSHGRLVNQADQEVCIDFQCGRGCKQSGHIHECSGCGETSHGALQCSLAQKGTSANSA